MTRRSLRPDPSMLRAWVDRLFVAAADTPSRLGTLRGVLKESLDPATLFEAALQQDAAALSSQAERAGADRDAFSAVAALVPVPFLQACNRRFGAAATTGWTRGYCPVCGSWPAFAEVRGKEHTRDARCGRCGAAWPSVPLACPYCGNSDHEQLLTLVPGGDLPRGVVEACMGCRGYLKALNRLEPCRPEAVMLEDLATADLDVAALEEGFHRPGGSEARC